MLDEDDKLDALKTQVFRELLTYMLQDPATIEPALDLILISRHLERIGDHATNVAEDVIFIVSARDVRHHAGRPLARRLTQAASSSRPEPVADVRPDLSQIESDGRAPLCVLCRTARRRAGGRSAASAARRGPGAVGRRRYRVAGEPSPIATETDADPD